jgi:hypothetical protein
VGQQPQLEWDERDQEIAELKAELNHTVQAITQLQQQNTELQEQVAYLQGYKKKPSRVAKENISILNLQKSRYKQKNSSTQSSKFLSERRFDKLSQLQITVIAILVAAGFTSVGLIVTRVFNQPHPIEPAVKQATKIPKLYEPSHSTPSVVSALPQNITPSPLNFSPQPLQKPNSEFAYNISMPTNFQPSRNLQAIVNELVDIAADQGLPTESLSITLVNTKTGESAGYKQQQQRFPASVVKLFWLVNFYAQVQRGIIPNEAAYDSDLFKMIQKSDNEAASRTLDVITDTESGSAIKGKEFEV